MRITIRHELNNRIRFDSGFGKMTFHQADLLLYYLESLKSVRHAKVYERTGDAVVHYDGNRQELLKDILKFSFNNPDIEALVPDHTSRELNSVYQEKMVFKIASRYLCNMFLPAPLKLVKTAYNAIRFISNGVRSLLRGELEVAVLDATAITVSLLRGDNETADTVMFMLGIGDILEEWTHKKSVSDLAQSMDLQVEKVWLKSGNQEVLIPVRNVVSGDLICIHTGTMIPFDGVVTAGEAMVNQASLTGEGIPIRKTLHSSVYAGTAVEEGELTMKVKASAGSTRYEKIVAMLEESEKMKAGIESKAEHLADQMVPITFIGTALVWLLTRNTTKALSVLMVDFSCALKLSMPVAVLSAMRECQNHSITVKGGKFLEAIAEADTIVFDKTGTLTEAKPSVAKIITFEDKDPDEMLRFAACLEEHFPHSIANAVVAEAIKKKLKHHEMHSKVEYIVAHGISSTINGEKVVIGSHHFIFDDEKCKIPRGEKKKYDNLPREYSHLYMAMSGYLVAVICVEDPIRPEAPDVVRLLRENGIKKLVMMTGDSERTAKAVAAKLGLDEYYAEVLPEDKAKFVQAEKAAGRKVIMLGDGINDSPALSAADAGIAVSEGAQIAREVADVTISENDLYKLVILKKISDGLMHRIHSNYRFVMSFNLSLIILGLTGVIAPTTSAFLHNTSTLGVGLANLTNIIEADEETATEKCDEAVLV